MSENNKPSIFAKLAEAGHSILDMQIAKAKASVLTTDKQEENGPMIHSKSVTMDPHFTTQSYGWIEKPRRLSNAHLKEMSKRDMVVAAVISTRQNQVAAYSRYVENENEKGWTLEFKDKETILEEIREELKKNKEKQSKKLAQQNGEEPSETNVNNTDDENEKIDWEFERKVKAELEKRFRKKKQDIKKLILNCGSLEERTFESKRWNFDTMLRAIVRDTLTYDLYALELVRDQTGDLHHWFPIDGGTIKYATKSLNQYKRMSETMYSLDILHPEKELEEMKDQKVLDLDKDKLDNYEYKWVQVIRGNVERAYTDEELKVGIRNITSDIYANGYGVAELEILVSMITGHLNAEYYNQAYFTNGFSAKGILHIKADIPPRQLEAIRQKWHHMIKGAKNSFQSPIFSGDNEVKWIPLTQNHNDIGFESWMRYLIRMICAIYQIDAAEFGVNLKDEGGGGGISGDNTKTKIDSSKDRGLFPLLKHIENFVNTKILAELDDTFEMKFTGLTGADEETFIDTLQKEAKFAKTVNEVREELGLMPLPGMDDIILDPTYMNWFSQYSDAAVKKQKEDQQNQMAQANMNQPPPQETPEQSKPDPFFDGAEDEEVFFDNPEISKGSKLKKSIIKIIEVDADEKED